MYITINNIKGESRIDLSYSIQNFESDKEIAFIRMLSDNVQYQLLKVPSVMDPISDTKKMVPNGTYASRELISILEGIIELNQFEIDDQVTKTNKLKGKTEITLNLDELNNSDNRDFKQHVRGALRRRRLYVGDWVEDAVVVTCTQTLSSSGRDNVYSAGNVLATRSRTIEQALVTHTH